MPQQSGTLHVVGIAGSLRTGSYNRALLRTAVDLAPDALRIEIATIGDLPLYDADLDTDERRPVPVVRLKAAVDAADGVLIASPEYNHSIPGVLQNAIDWVSRPGGRSPLRDKPVAIMGASTGPVGTARGQQMLKLSLMSTMALILPHPGVLVAVAKEKFDDAGTLTHQPTRDFVAGFLGDFERWIGRVGKVETAA